MKYLYRFILSFLIFVALGFPGTVLAQDHKYPWQLGVGIGYTNYYGDVSNYRISGASELYKIYKFGNYNKYYQHQPSFSLLLQKKITPTLGLMFQANYLQFGMSDRYRKNDGSYDTASANFSRSLNFRTTMQDAGLAFTFSPNNGRIGSENAFFYPSFYLGLGVSTFMVKGDLYDANNKPYNYRLPGNINDDTYETNLRDQRSESDDKFRNVEPYVDLGLALNFRISQLLTIALQSDIKYSASDYLDNVSAIYKTSYPTAAEATAAYPGYNVINPATRQRGDNNGVNDFYINNRVVLNISLSRKKTTKPFVPPVIYSLSAPAYYYQKKTIDSAKKNVSINIDSLIRIKKDSVSKAFRDSISAVNAAIAKSSILPDSAIRKQLANINTELKGIKEILRDQQIKPRLFQLQYQTDSIKSLRSRVLNQRPISKENNLQLRVYDLQLDSLRNEYEKVQQRQGLPLSKADSAALFYHHDYSIGYLPPEKPIDTTSVVRYSYDSIRLHDSYLKKVDSIQQRLNELEKKSADINKKKALDSVAVIKNKMQMDNQLQKDEEAMTLLQRQLKVASDSAVYYKKQQDASRFIIKPDTVEKKKNWFQRHLAFGSKKKKPVAKADTVESIDYSMQQDYYQSQADLANNKIKNVEKDKNELLEKRMNYTRENNLIIDSAERARNLNEMRNRIQRNTDSLTLLQQQLKRSDDSGAYYKKQMQDVSEKTNAADKKWYQSLFTSERTKQKKIEAESDIRDHNIQQQQYYDNDVRNMQARISDLERRNNDLENSYQSYKSLPGRNSFPVTPIVINGGSNNSSNDYQEIAVLRAQLQNLQNEIDYDARGRHTADSIKSIKSPQVVILPTPVAPAPVTTTDTTQISLLRNELNKLKTQLDSIKNKPPTVIADKPVKPEQKYDVTSFPVVSVYFKLGSVSLSADQLNKIIPFARVANKDSAAAIVLKGFTDPVGNAEKNIIIANKRSEYIKNFLVSKYKIGESRITIEEPAGDESNTTKKANPLDRRVDLQFQ